MSGGQQEMYGQGLLEEAKKYLTYFGTANVKLFGAVGDGARDDTAAVKEAIRHLPEEGGVLLFPPGVWVGSDEWTVAKHVFFKCSACRYVVKEALLIPGGRPISLRGAGPEVTTLVWPKDAREQGVSIVQHCARTPCGAVCYTLVESLTLTSQMPHDAVPETAALKIDMSGQVRKLPAKEQESICERTDARVGVRGLHIKGSWHLGLDMLSTIHTSISDFVFSGVKHTHVSKAGIRYAGGGSPTDHSLSTCRVFWAERGIEVLSEAKGRIEGLALDRCVMVACGTGLYCNSCLALNMMQCHVNAAHRCVDATNVDQSIIVGNLFYQNHGEGSGVHITGQNKANSNLIAHNIVQAVRESKNLTGVVLEDKAQRTLVSQNILNAPWSVRLRAGDGGRGDFNGVWVRGNMDRHANMMDGSVTLQGVDEWNLPRCQGLPCFAGGRGRLGAGRGIGRGMGRGRGIGRRGRGRGFDPAAVRAAALAEEHADAEAAAAAATAAADLNGTHLDEQAGQAEEEADLMEEAEMIDTEEALVGDEVVSAE